MNQIGLDTFYEKIHQQKVPFPFDAQIELTYRCNLTCVHCYCRGMADKKQELSTGEVKRIIDTLHQQGCIWLSFTGGEPFIRDDFLELYAYAKQKGFIINILTNGQLLSSAILRYLAISPPQSIELTLNGIRAATYEQITGVPGSFRTVISAIKKIVKLGLPLVVKTNLMRQNAREILRIKKWVEKTVGKPGRKHFFKYDPLIYPRMNGDRSPCAHRLSGAELEDVLRQDVDMWQQYQAQANVCLPAAGTDSSQLYRCNSWMAQAFINPYGKLKFCLFSEKFSADLRHDTFDQGFISNFSRIPAKQFKTASACRACRLRPLCLWCPAKAVLETGNEESPVAYYCAMAQATVRGRTR